MGRFKESIEDCEDYDFILIDGVKVYVVPEDFDIEPNLLDRI